MIERVAIDGTDLDLGDVFASVTIRHGRSAVDDSPLGSTATLSLVNVDAAFTAPFTVGVELAVDTTGAVERFRGRITDADLDAGEATLSLIASSTLARISGRKVGAVDWPSEAWSARVARAFTEADAIAELVLQVGDVDPMLAARPAGEATLAELLQELAQTVASAVADLPNGDVLVQAITSRKELDPVELDPELVAYAPEWKQTDDVANVVRVEWDGGTVEQTDAGSVLTFEERAPLSIKTELLNLSDANARALLELNRRSRPDWQVDRAELLELDAALAIGVPVVLTDLPSASPDSTVIGMLEGWEDHVEPDVGGGLAWSMILSLSAPRLSGYGLSWGAVDAAVTWADAGAITWADPDDLATL